MPYAPKKVTNQESTLPTGFEIFLSFTALRSRFTIESNRTTAVPITKVRLSPSILPSRISFIPSIVTPIPIIIRFLLTK